MAKNILRRQFSNMYGKNKPYQNPEPLPISKESLPKLESPHVSVTMVILFTILVFLGLFLYLNRAKVYGVFQKMMVDFSPSKEIDKAEERYHALTQDASYNAQRIDKLHNEKERLDMMEQKQNRILEILEKPVTIESKEKEKKEETKKDESSGIGKLNERISGYCKNQTVNSNGFCYIGYDNNQRECASVSEGDICMSGQVFPTMDVCLYPKLRP